MDYRGLLYSTDKDVTISDLKNDDYDRHTVVDPVCGWMEKHDISCSVKGNGDYHYKFHHIKSSPFLYYWQGNYDVLNKPLLAIVGPRKMSGYAEEVLRVLFTILEKYDIATVSGMADGVDSVCHQLSIEHGLPTIGVLGAGLGYYLSRTKRHAIRNIVAHEGLVVSEFKLKQAPAPYTFPQRNRIIAGLSTCLFLPEAGEKSGSLITVDDALVMHKPVFGSPQDMFSRQSLGLSRYMQDGKVRVVVDLEEFVAEMFGEYIKDGKSTNKLSQGVVLNDVQIAIVDFIQKHGKPVGLDALQQSLSVGSGILLSELSVLEISGLVSVTDSGCYRLC